jgi:hypothetical protein
MNRTVISLLVFVLLLMLIFSPFAAFAGLMLVLFISGLFTLIVNIFKILVWGEESKRDFID